MVRAYLSAPIIDIEKQENNFCQAVIDILEEKGIEVFAPQFMPASKPHDIFRRDTTQIRMCDFLIAEVTNASLGVGMEIMLAIELIKPILMFSKKGTPQISLMVKGADGKAMFEYETPKDVVNILQGINLMNLIVSQCPLCDSQVAEISDEGLRCVACGMEGHQVMV
jgi:nucleoside 2-deoxyribosyltransferase